MTLLTGLLRPSIRVIAFAFVFSIRFLNCILADQAQCHRVSSALEAGTVSYPFGNELRRKLTLVL
jgi:hypothetical protein